MNLAATILIIAAVCVAVVKLTQGKQRPQILRRNTYDDVC